MALVHHHLIFHARVDREFTHHSTDVFETFLLDLVELLEMKVLIPPHIKRAEDGWSGFVGIVTSHIAFHHWENPHYVQVDIYSCKKFDKEKAVAFIADFWKAQKVNTLFIDREVGKKFKITKEESENTE